MGSEKTSEDGKGETVNLQIPQRYLWPLLLALCAGGASGGGFHLAGASQSQELGERLAVLEAQMEIALENDRLIQSALRDLARQP